MAEKTWEQRIAAWDGRAVRETDLDPYQTVLDEINGPGESLRRSSDAELRAKGATFRGKIGAGADPALLLAEVFAAARKLDQRTLGLRPFDTQMLAGMALYRGKLVELPTGEGKTLAAVMPAALHGLTGRGVHVLTFNDYLARREVERLQRIVGGQNHEIRKTLARYASLIEKQRTSLALWRAEVLTGSTELSAFATALPELHAELVARYGASAVRSSERRTTLHEIDAAWADHLAYITDVREGIHLVGLGGMDPFNEFHKRVAAAFTTLHASIDA